MKVRPARVYHFAGVVALLLLCGCLSRERLADQVVMAPNLRIAAPRLLVTNVVNAGNPLELSRVAVRLPEAEISVAVLPPGKYPGSSLYALKRGDERILELRIALASWGMKFQQAGEEVAERGTVFLLHGYGLSKESMIPWAFILASEGYRCVIVDLRGHGASTGKTISFGKYETRDLEQLLDYLIANNSCKAPVAVLGISLGANVGMHWASQDPRVTTVIAVAPFNDPVTAAVRLKYLLRLPISERLVRGSFSAAASRLQVDWNDWAGSVAALEARHPILFLAGSKDEISPPDEISHMRALAPAESEFVVIPDADHEALGIWLETMRVPVIEWLEAHLAPNAEP